MLVENGTLVLALDGGRMALYHNSGSGLGCNLELVCSRENALSDTADIGADRPGRSFASSGVRRSSVGQTDWHQQSEDSFTAAAIRLLGERAGQNDSPVIVIAPPKALGVARKHYSNALKKRIVAEFDQDYAARTPEDISAMLVEK